MINSGGIKGGGKAMMGKNSHKITLEKTAKYLKKVNSTLSEKTMEVKIPAEKIEVKRNKKLIFRVPNNQELVRKVKTIYRRNMISPRGIYMRNTADIIPNAGYICNGYLNELGETGGNGNEK